MNTTYLCCRSRPSTALQSADHCQSLTAQIYCRIANQRVFISPLQSDSLVVTTMGSLGSQRRRRPFSMNLSLLLAVSLLLCQQQCYRPVAAFSAPIPPPTDSSAIIPPPAQLPVPSDIKLLILPGFGNDAIDYVAPTIRMSRAEPVVTSAVPNQGSLVESLYKRGWRKDQVYVLPVQRSEWINVFAKGLFFDPLFFSGDMPPTRPAYRWYLQKVAQCIRDITGTSSESVPENDSNGDSETSDDLSSSCKVVLIGHSAGGWLARAALGFGSLVEGVSADNNSTNVDTDIDDSIRISLEKITGLVTLGAPHLPPPPEIMDMTRGALRITHTTFPDAYHQSLFYITIVGDAMQGIKQEKQLPWQPTTVTGFAYNAYKAVCGDGSARGDGVVPLQSAHLQGAKQLTLPGVFHSINIPEKWYGSDSQIDAWHNAMLEELNTRAKASSVSIAASS